MAGISPDKAKPQVLPPTSEKKKQQAKGQLPKEKAGKIQPNKMEIDQQNTGQQKQEVKLSASSIIQPPKDL